MQSWRGERLGEAGAWRGWDRTAWNTDNEAIDGQQTFRNSAFRALQRRTLEAKPDGSVGLAKETLCPRPAPSTAAAATAMTATATTATATVTAEGPCGVRGLLVVEARAAETAPAR